MERSTGVLGCVRGEEEEAERRLRLASEKTFFVLFQNDLLSSEPAATVEKEASFRRSSSRCLHSSGNSSSETWFSEGNLDASASLSLEALGISNNSLPVFPPRDLSSSTISTCPDTIARSRAVSVVSERQLGFARVACLSQSRSSLVAS